MLVNSFRSLYSFSSKNPASLIRVCNTHLLRYFCTESREQLKPEDKFGDQQAGLASRYSKDYSKDDSRGSDMTILEAINKIKKFIGIYEFDQANEVFNELKKTKKPPPYIYKLLFASAARLGKIEEAFHIYNDLKKRGLYADGAMYTSLFYGCAKCPRSDVALPIADKLMKYMFENKKYKPNKSNFNAVMMTYGRHGDISTVMMLIDKQEEEGKYLTCKTYNFALDSCISQKNSGLRFAILIWHHMLKKKIVPNLYTFSILGRCVRDCSLGDSDLCNEFINSFFKNCPNKIIGESPKPNLNSGEFVIKEESQEFSMDVPRGDDVKETDYSDTNENKLTDTVLDVRNNQAEKIESGEDISVETENNEEIQQYSYAVKGELSNDCSLSIGNKEEFECTTHNENSDSEKAISLTSGDSQEPTYMFDTEDKSQLKEIQSTVESSSKVETHQFDNSDLPNLLTLKPPGKSIVKFGDFSTPENRLLLFGGLKGFLKAMGDHKVKPDIVLFSTLLECIPSTKEDEEALMNEMKTYKVKVDTTFLNILIKRKILRNEDSTPEDFLDLFKKYRRLPDMVTFGTIARSCVTHESGKKCIQLARSHNIRLNNAILGCLLKNAGKTGDMAYVSDILNAGKEDGTELDSRFVSILKYIVDKEKMKRKKSIC